ncbi:hypothetical protein Tco_1506601 [Tanacetum coccineum]
MVKNTENVGYAGNAGNALRNVGNIMNALWNDGNAQTPDNYEKGDDAKMIKCYDCNGVGIQEVNSDSEAGPSYDIDVISEVPDYDTCYIHDMYSVSAHEKRHLEQPESINDTYVDDQTDSNILFDTLYMDVNRGEFEQDETSHDHNCVIIESLIKNMQLEVERCNTTNCEAKETNASLTVELESYKERINFFENKQDKQNEYEMAYKDALNREKDLQKLLYHQLIFDNQKIDALTKMMIFKTKFQSKRSHLQTFNMSGSH